MDINARPHVGEWVLYKVDYVAPEGIMVTLIDYPSSNAMILQSAKKKTNHFPGKFGVSEVTAVHATKNYVDLSARVIESKEMTEELRELRERLRNLVKTKTESV